MSPQIERVFLDTPTAVGESWWDRYAATLTRLTPTARAALQADCTYIRDRGIFGAGDPDPYDWPIERTRTGLVMGSVQSGKTASMLGVTALSLDHGADIVVILAGTRLSLWRQTYDRLSEQLDVGEAGPSKSRRRHLCPPSASALEGSLRDIYRIPSLQAKRKLSEHKPIIVVAMKQTDHLYALGRTFRDSVFPQIRDLERPVHMLVLDDEADDGSILDAVVEAGQSPFWQGYKQIPRAIADLWDPKSEVAPENLFTTYVGYTATPQASLLQEDHNPLSPRDFVISLRTPGDRGEPIDLSRDDAPRSTTYPEPQGVDSYYTGGEVYYLRGERANLCVELTNQPDDLGEAIRAFLVASAVRLHWAAGKTGPRSLIDASFDSEDDAKVVSPDPSSMLFHPAAAIDDHFEGAVEVLLWAGVSDRRTARNLVESGEARLPDVLISKMRADQPRWEAWLDRYRESSAALADEFNVMNPRPLPAWSTVRELLEKEIICGTRVSVVNSDPAADDRPRYEPTLDEATRRWRAAPDLCTIFVSGNVMARGLTLEGMTTALFRRSVNTPYADTQMQMQRWFGYRGPYIELCRLFARSDQLNLFRSYHDIDEAIRIAITKQMAGEAPSPVVLHGLQFLATGKIANLPRTPLCPGSQPFVTIINDGVLPDPNAGILAELFSSRPSSDVIVTQRNRGRALDSTLSLREAADLLDALAYDGYKPGTGSAVNTLWSQIQDRVSEVYPLPPDTNLYCPPEPDPRVEPSPARLDCPYSIAAYLRLWDACLTRAVRGLFVTGAPDDLWSRADLQAKYHLQPRFSVGIRYGDGNVISSGPLAGLDFGIRATAKSLNSRGELSKGWGTNDPWATASQYRGDSVFDYYHRGEAVPLLATANPWRPPGSHGQILFYVNQRVGQPHPTVAVGVCIPAGGPEQFAATRALARVAAA